MTVSPERAGLDDQFMKGHRMQLIVGYQRLAETEPEAGLFRRLGICLVDDGQFEAAKTAFRRALAMDHSDIISKRRLMQLDMAPISVPAKQRKAPRATRPPRVSVNQEGAKQHFLSVFPKGFADPGYFKDERDYKWAAHLQWQETLAQPMYDALLSSGGEAEVCARLRGIISGNKSRHGVNLPSTFELMALNSLMTSPETQRMVAEGVHSLVYGPDFGNSLDRFVLALQRLNVKGSKPFAWPIVTLFPFIADPVRHMFVKPEATKAAATRLGLELNYKSVPNSLTYGRVVELAGRLLDDLKDLAPRDMIDLQSFVWVTHSDGYGI